MLAGFAGAMSITAPPQSATSYHASGVTLSRIRNPSDPLFFASIMLQNIVVGSRYWIARASDLSDVLAEGVAETSEITLENIPAYANPMLFEVRVRKGSGSPNYQPYKTFGYLVRDGATVYIAQVEDEVNVL